MAFPFFKRNHAKKKKEKKETQEEMLFRADMYEHDENDMDIFRHDDKNVTAPAKQIEQTADDSNNPVNDATGQSHRAEKKADSSKTTKTSDHKEPTNATEEVQQLFDLQPEATPTETTDPVEELLRFAETPLPFDDDDFSVPDVSHPDAKKPGEVPTFFDINDEEITPPSDDELPPALPQQTENEDAPLVSWSDFQDNTPAVSEIDDEPFITDALIDEELLTDEELPTPATDLPDVRKEQERSPERIDTDKLIRSYLQDDDSLDTEEDGDTAQDEKRAGVTRTFGKMIHANPLFEESQELELTESVSTNDVSAKSNNIAQNIERSNVASEHAASHPDSAQQDEKTDNSDKTDTDLPADPSFNTTHTTATRDNKDTKNDKGRALVPPDVQTDGTSTTPSSPSPDQSLTTGQAKTALSSVFTSQDQTAIDKTNATTDTTSPITDLAQVVKIATHDDTQANDTQQTQSTLVKQQIYRFRKKGDAATSSIDKPRTKTKHLKRINKQKTSKRLSRPAKILITAGVALLVAGACIFTLLFSCRIKTVTFENLSFYTPEEVVETLGIEKNDFLLLLSTKQIEQVIAEKYPYIQSISIRRNLPDNLVITVNQEAPVFYVEVLGDYFIVSSNLRVLARYDSEEEVPSGLIRLYTSQVSRAIVGETLSFTDDTYLTFLNNFIPRLMQTDLAANITDMDLTYRYRITFHYENRLEITFGSATDFETKILFLEGIISKLNETDTGTINLIDLRTAAVNVTSAAE